MYLIGAFVTQHFPDDQLDDLDFFSVPIIDPSVPSAEEAPTDGYFAAARTRQPGRREGTALLPRVAGGRSSATSTESGTSNLPTSPEVDTSQFAPLVQKGIELLNATVGDHAVLQPRLQRRAADHGRHRPHPVPRRPVGHPGPAAGLADGRREGLLRR